MNNLEVIKKFKINVKGKSQLVKSGRLKSSKKDEDPKELNLESIGVRLARVKTKLVASKTFKKQSVVLASKSEPKIENVINNSKFTFKSEHKKPSNSSGESHHQTVKKSKMQSNETTKKKCDLQKTPGTICTKRNKKKLTVQRKKKI